MQHMKITENLGEFQKFLNNDNKTGLCLEDTIQLLFPITVFQVDKTAFEGQIILGNDSK